MASLFTRIVNGEIPCHKIAENDNFLAFLDINPLHEGHSLVIPKKEVDYIFNLDQETYSGLWAFASQVSKKIENAVSCERIGVAVIGLEVPHAHIHLVPINNVEDINFSRKKLSFSNEELAACAERISTSNI